MSAVLPFRRTSDVTRADLRRVARARARQRETLAMVDAELARIRWEKTAPARAARVGRRRLVRDRLAAALLVYTTLALSLWQAGVPLAIAAVAGAAFTLALVGVLLFVEDGGAP